MRRSVIAVALVFAALGVSGTARAGSGYPPFYGYSTYFGGPSTYFTPENDVEQATTIRGDGKTVTYYRGGPFWTYHPNAVRRASYTGHSRRRVVLRRRG